MTQMILSFAISINNNMCLSRENVRNTAKKKKNETVPIILVQNECTRP